MATENTTQAYDSALVKQVNNLRVEVSRMQAANATRKQMIDGESTRRTQGIDPTTGAQSLQENLRKFLPPYLMPGNLGDINKVIWPFWFTINTQEIPLATAGVQGQGKGVFTVTYEAAFVMMSYTRSVFKRNPADPTLPLVDYSYVDPDNYANVNALSGLSFTMIDAQSRRLFMDTPIEMDHVGNPRYPSVLPTPLLFMPNSTVEVQFYNTNAVDTFVPWITFFGYRVRIEDAQKILSLVHA